MTAKKGYNFDADARLMLDVSKKRCGLDKWPSTQPKNTEERRSSVANYRRGTETFKLMGKSRFIQIEASLIGKELRTKKNHPKFEERDVNSKRFFKL